MSNQDRKNYGEEPSYPSYGDRVTFNPAAEDTSDSARKNIEEMRGFQAAQIGTILPAAIIEDDDEDIPTGVKDWNEPNTALIKMPIFPQNEGDDYEMVSADEISIGELPQDVQDEVEIDQMLYDLGNPAAQFGEANALYTEVDNYNEEDFGPSARIFDVMKGEISLPTVNPPENKELLDELINPQIDPRYKFLDEDCTLDLAKYSQVIWEFIESRYAKLYFSALKNYQLLEKNPEGNISKEPLIPPKIEIYLEKFKAELEKKK